jgi:hypothetical protein
VSEDYIARINAIVKNKITFSKSVADLDYYDYVLKALKKQQTPSE